MSASSGSVRTVRAASGDTMEADEMRDATISVMIAAAQADETLTSDDVRNLKLYLTGRTGEAWRGNETMDQVVPCKAAAEILHVSPRTLQLYARRGFIHPVRLGAAGARAIGYTRSSLQEAMAKRS